MTVRWELLVAMHSDCTSICMVILEQMEKKFGKLAIMRGNKHTFLGMNITIRKDRKFEVEMTEQLKETIQAFGEEITGVVTTPAGSNLMKVPGQDEELDEERVKRFHSVVAKLLYLMKRVRPDLEPTISFLCTRVSKCVRSDWEKLRRALCYVKNTINDV